MTIGDVLRVLYSGDDGNINLKSQQNLHNINIHTYV